MRGVLLVSLAPLSGLLASCGLVSGLDNLSVCTTGCVGGDAGSDALVIETDAGSDSDVDAPTPWSPASVTGLALWLDATSSSIKLAGNNNTSVTSWGDLSPNHNDAVQQLAPLQPTMVKSSINNLAAVHFTSNANVTTPGHMLTIADSASLQWGTGDFYVVTVAKFDNAPADGLTAGVGAFYAKGNTTTNIMVGLGGNTGGWTGSNQGTAGFQGSAGALLAMSSGPYNDGVARMYACHRDSTNFSFELRLNGATVAKQLQQQPEDVSATGATAVIGALGDASSNRLDGDIAEMIAVKAPTATDIASIEAYLQKKYALP